MIANQSLDNSTSRTQKKPFLLCLIICLMTLIGLTLMDLGLFIRFENTLWDKRLALLAHYQKPDPKIRIITIDQSSLDYFATEEKITWPWPRALYEPVVRFLEKAGARGVAFDILFTEASSYGEEDDQALAASFSATMPIVLSAAFRNGPVASTVESRDFKLGTTPAQSMALGSRNKILKFSTSAFPVESLANRASGIGNVSLGPDSDGIFRHTAPFALMGNQSVLALPFALSVATGGSLEALQHFSSELKREGRLAISFMGGARTYRTDPIAAIIQSYLQLEAGQVPTIDPAGYRDTLVFVGMDAPGLLDLRPIPLAEIYPGTEFNATVLDNLERGRFIHKPTRLKIALLIAVLAALCSVSILFPRRLLHQILLLGFVIGSFTLFAIGATLSGWWIPLAVPLTCSLLTAFSCLGSNYQREGRQNRFLRHAFKHYVSSAVIDRIITEPNSLAIGGERRELSIFFSDIEGFTKISEKLPADKLVELLNVFLSEMSDIILSTGGTVDKYVGDAIVAFWNAPLPVPDHAARAVSAALDCQQRLAELRSQFETTYGVTVRMRIGIHTGMVNVGNFGSRDRFNYTVIGDAANLASRLEGANKTFGTFVMISEDTYQAAHLGPRARKIAEIIVVGKEQSTLVFEPLTSNTDKKKLSQFESARILFERGALQESLAAFELITDDPVAAAYIKRITRELTRAAENTEFSSLWNLTEK